MQAVVTMLSRLQDKFAQTALIAHLTRVFEASLDFFTTIQRSGGNSSLRSSHAEADTSSVELKVDRKLSCRIFSFHT
jgi:hypothetical protein